MHQFLPFIVIGLATGAVYGLAGLGLVLTYKTSGVFNFGYGSVAALASFLFYFLHTDHGFPWPLAALITLAIGAPVMGLFLELVARLLDGATETLKVVATVGLILIADAIASLWFPVNPPTFPHFLPTSTVKVLGVNVTWEQIILFLFSIAASAVLYWFFRSVRLGIAMRGLVDSQELVAMSGDSPMFVRRWAWVIGTVFASIAGLLLAPDLPLDGVSLTTLVFAAFGSAAFGYFANMPLTFVGGLLVGVIGALADKYSGTISWVGGIPPSLPFIILFLVLVLMPRARLVTRKAPALVKVRAAYRAPVRVRLTAGTITVALLAVMPLIQQGKLVLWSNALIDIILFLSLGLLVRNSGQISLCHLAFAAVGASAFGHFADGLGLPWLVALGLAMLVAVPVGAVIAIPAIRLSGVYLALATLGFGLLAQYVFYFRWFMFGTRNLGVREPRPNISIAGLNLTTDKGFYYVLLVITLLVVVAVTAVSNERLGRLLRGMADSSLALETHGASSTVLKVIVFCIAAALAALAGALTGMLFHFGVAGYFQPFDSLTLVVLVVILAIGDPWYAVLGAVGRTVIPGYVHGATVNSALTILFGTSALVAVWAVRSGGTPASVQSWLDRLGGRKHGLALVALDTGATSGVTNGSIRGAEPGIPAVTGSDGTAVRRDGLTVRELGVAFGGLRAVNQVDLSVPMRRITGLIGPNGAGKTTIFNVCSGLIHPNAGRVLLHGTELSRKGLPARARQGLGRSFQRPEVFNTFTVRQNVAMGCEAAIAGASPARQLLGSRRASRFIAAATDKALVLTGIERIADAQVGILPIGQRRLVELASVLAGPFDLLLLDEPSSGLDGHETEAFGRVLQNLVAERGVGIFLVEHDMTLVRAICEYVYVLDFGSLIFEGTPEQMQHSERVRAAYLGETVSIGGADRQDLSSEPIAPAVPGD